MVTAAGSQKLWQIAERDAGREQTLALALGVSPLCAAILLRRGYVTPESASKFLNPNLDDLGDPERLPDFHAACTEILGAKERGERIFVHGDYDVDGVTSAAIFSRFLKGIGCEVTTHVPHRFKEGYGICEEAVLAAYESGAKLFLTCDCGASADARVRQAHELGMRVVVTDHHELPTQIPAAEAVVNLHRAGHDYPAQELCGAGVAFRLCEGLVKHIGGNVDAYRRKFLDLAVLGTVADVMPLTGENRIITYFGLQQLASTQKSGLIALMEQCDLKVGQVKASDIGFKIGPRLNAVGRLDDAALALELLLETDLERARVIASTLEQINTRRRAEQIRIVDAAVLQVERDGLHKRRVIVVAGEDWNSGVVGLVAGNLVEKFNRPVFVLAVNKELGTARGSARSIDEFNVYEAIQHQDMVSGGGHAKAAGITCSAGDVVRFADSIDEYAGKRLSEHDLIPKIHVDCEVDPCEADLNSARELSRLEPFGYRNPRPVFAARGVTFAQLCPTKKPEHYRCTFRCADGEHRSGMAFGLGSRIQSVPIGATGDIVFELVEDTFNGAAPKASWHLRDFQVAASTSS